MKIAGRHIGDGQRPYVVAELSGNHGGRLEDAKRLITRARQAGADAVKLQTYRPETMTVNSADEAFTIRGGLWDGRTLWDLYAWAQTPWEWHEALFRHARECGITIFSSPFDHAAVDLLESLDAPAYKIASFELVDLDLIAYAAATGKPMILSTGMADEREIDAAVATARTAGCRELALLHCVSAYPAPASDYHLRRIPELARRHKAVAGLSDHSLGQTVAIASVGLGASLIEKHFTLDRNSGGPDDAFSLEPDELAALCRAVAEAWEAMGQGGAAPTISERTNRQFRRSLYFSRDLAAGHRLTDADVQALRPALGLAPKWRPQLVGMRLRHAVRAGDPVGLKDLDGALNAMDQPE